MNSTPEECRAYCANAAVRTRMRDYFGRDARGEPLAVFLTIGTEHESRHREALPVEELTSWLDRGVEVNRSLWDRESLLCHLDIEYVHFDDPGYPFHHPERIFALQAPVIAAADTFLASFGIHPLKLLTGRGFHLLWRITQHSAAFAQLAALGHVSATLRHLYATERAPTGEHVSAELGSAFAGLGCVIEFIAHQIKSLAAATCELPVELGAIETGTGANGREMISVDVTEYADPLCSRVIRAPFSLYLKPQQQGEGIKPGQIDNLPPLVTIPLGKLPIADALRRRSDLGEAAQLAETACVDIPDASLPMERLIHAYQGSHLAQFHAEFYSQEHDAPARWPETYDLTPLEALPPCARMILDRPNDLLLRPACAQRIVRVMLALGWHPRHIGGLIRSKYERDHGWGDQWRGCDPGTRADFYARVFTGLFVTGVDDLVDFNCQSAREEGNCFIPQCDDNLQTYRDSLIERRTHERLACRPFNRLFLPTEHL